MTAWRARLAALRSEYASVKRANSADRWGLSEATGANGASDTGIERQRQARAAFLARAAADAFAALAGPELGPEAGQVDHDRPEREALAAHYAGPEVGR